MLKPPLHHVIGFLPILPHPVTEYDTVYTAMENFLSIIKQTKQDYMPIAADEGVYCIAKHIQLTTDKFNKIILIMGDFHWAKIYMSCIGKYLFDSRIQNMFIETGLFVINVTDQVLNATNY